MYGGGGAHDFNFFLCQTQQKLTLSGVFTDHFFPICAFSMDSKISVLDARGPLFT